jgi:hypothetical protein
MERFHEEKSKQIDEVDEEMQKLKKKLEVVKRSNTLDRSEL